MSPFNWWRSLPWGKREQIKYRIRNWWWSLRYRSASGDTQKRMLISRMREAFEECSFSPPSATREHLKYWRGYGGNPVLRKITPVKRINSEAEKAIDRFITKGWN